jgi:hypothetical protein
MGISFHPYLQGAATEWGERSFLLFKLGVTLLEMFNDFDG